VTFEPGKKHLFLDISSINFDKPVLSLYQCAETRSTEIFWPLSQPLRTPVSLSTTFERPWENFSIQFEQLYATDTSHGKQETFFNEYPLHWVLLPTEKRTTERYSSVVRTFAHINFHNGPRLSAWFVIQIETQSSEIPSEQTNASSAVSPPYPLLTCTSCTGICYFLNSCNNIY
jgi:hypothetical protein